MERPKKEQYRYKSTSDNNPTIDWDEYYEDLEKYAEYAEKQFENNCIFQNVSESKWLIDYEDADGTTHHIVYKAKDEEGARFQFRTDFTGLRIIEVNEITYSR